MSIVSSDDYSDLASVKSNNTDSCAALEDLKSSIQKMAGQLEQLRGGVKVETGILTSIVGSWRIVSSIGVKEYLANFTKSDISGIWQATFETGIPTFSYDENAQKLTMFFTIGSQTLYEATVNLGERSIANGTRQMTFVEDNSLVTALLQRSTNEEFSREERFVKDGRLHCVTKRFGMRCTRVYEKVEKERL